MYKTEQQNVFVKRALSGGHSIDYKIYRWDRVLVARTSPRRPEQDPSTRQGDLFKQEALEKWRSNSQLIKTSWKGTKREQHLNCLIEKKRKKN